MKNERRWNVDEIEQAMCEVIAFREGVVMASSDEDALGFLLTASQMLEQYRDELREEAKMGGKR